VAVEHAALKRAIQALVAISLFLPGDVLLEQIFVVDVDLRPDFKDLLHQAEL
jgi:hypothetical protein